MQKVLVFRTTKNEQFYSWCQSRSSIGSVQPQTLPPLCACAWLPWRYVTCEEPVKGRFVAVYREERGQIQMCEFEVFRSQNTGKHTKMNTKFISFVAYRRDFDLLKY